MTEAVVDGWIVEPRQREAERRLERELGVSSIVAALLVQRGYADPELAERFLNPRLDDLHDPALLPDYESARNEILGAKERGERIFVHGDYDVDGITSASIFDRFLKKIGCDVVTHVPHRLKEGYGIHASAVEAAKEAGAALFLTCDCGISAFEQVAAAREAGLRVVVTDHHTVHEQIPEAHAVVNPHVPGSIYPWPELSGAGVVLKLCAGLTQEIGWPMEAFYKNFLDLAALGTIADVMPLVGENRIIAWHGLIRLSETTKPGLVALKRVSDLAGPVTAYHVGYVLGPRLNAAGRIDDAAIALELLLEQDEVRALQLATKINQINLDRRAEQSRIIDEAIRMVREKGQDSRNVILVGHESWHAGVVGIVANRLVEVFRRPAFVATLAEDGKGKASARSIPKFHLAQALADLDHLLQGGGHAMAAGCSFEYDQIEQIAEALHEYAAKFIGEEDFKIVRRADLEVDSSEVTFNAVQELCKLEPFGTANPEPMFVARAMTLARLKPCRDPIHYMVTLIGGESRPAQAMAFSLGERLGSVQPGSVADIFFRPVLDEWRGQVSLKWHVRDFALC